MQLVAISDASADDLRFMVREVRAVKIFYVSTGRNAWWSTWITRYTSGCMHSTLESARAFCERRRVQGTVFYINELPSLAFIAPERALVVSEINTDSFFGRLDAERLTSLTTVFPVSTMTLDQMRFVFRAESPLWPRGYPRRDSAILSYCSGSKMLAEITPSSELQSYASSSYGRNYLLGWSKRPFSKQRSALHSIASGLQSRMNSTQLWVQADRWECSGFNPTVAGQRWLNSTLCL